MPSALGYLLRNAAVVCGSSAPAKRLAERLWDSDIRRGSALVHRPSHISVDLVYVDEADPGLCRDIAIIKHCSYRPVVILGTEQVRAPYLIDDPSSRCNLRFRGDPRCRRGSQLRWWRGRRCRLLRWWSRRLRACAETACQENGQGVSFHCCPPCPSQDLSNRRRHCAPNLDVLHFEPHRSRLRSRRRAPHSRKLPR
jgi:hypothetical protein